MKEGWHPFLKLCLACRSEDELMDLLHLFLTPEEKESLSARYLIVEELLQKEKTQRQMAKDLQVSIAKITRGSNELKRIKPSLKAFLEEKMRGC